MIFGFVPEWGRDHHLWHLFVGTDFLNHVILKMARKTAVPLGCSFDAYPNNSNINRVSWTL